MTSPTTNKGYTYPAHGAAVNSWDTPLNTNFDQIDQNLGSTYLITITSTATTATYNSTGATLSSTVATATLPAANAQNLYYKLTGTLTQNLDLAFPAVGSFYGIQNGTSGSFSLTAIVSGSTSVNVSIAQGGTNFIITDGSNVVLANSNVLAKFQSYLGSPNGNVAGTVATANGGATDAVWDVTNRQLYVTTTTGSTATTVWLPQVSRLTPQGYLTISADNNNPIVVSDTTGTAVKYVPFVGNWMVFSTGTVLFPYSFSAMTLTLTNAQAASVIYDVYAFYNSGSPMIGTGPAWSVSTAGSGSRGAAAAITRLAGVWVNDAAITLTNNGAPTACSSGQGIYLGSLLIDSAAGNVSCLPSVGQSRKWGVWNAYNREPIPLRATDTTATWTSTSASWRASNGNSNNVIQTFSGLPEESVGCLFVQTKTDTTTTNDGRIGIGVNVTTSPSGKVGRGAVNTGTIQYFDLTATHTLLPTIGLNNIQCIEFGGASAGNFLGTETSMVMTVSWRG